MKLVRKEENKITSAKSLYQTWSDLFFFRALGRQGVIRLDEKIIQEFHQLANYSWPRGTKYMQKHYQHQFQIVNSVCPLEYYIGELAIWDLRCLIREVYGVSEESVKEQKYTKFIDKISQTKKNIVGIVNLNYDTTFDHALKNRICYFLDGQSFKDKMLLIRPHGSLDWTSQSHWSISKGNWRGWIESYKSFDKKISGYKVDKNNPDLLNFYQSLIVPPVDVKEEVVGNSSMPGLQSSILLNQWRALSLLLKNEEKTHWIFYGISFALGDNHLAFLLRNAMHSNIKIHASCFENSKKQKEKEKNLQKIFRPQEDSQICTQHSVKTIDNFELSCE
ncbi:MAG: hypothetical protein HYS08_08650 [Chlamydiae bacterium]|nr:hypothetical protein [Chlamydiota bacterium]